MTVNFRSTTERAAGCVSEMCRPSALHAPCVDCSILTCDRSMRIDPQTLRRRVRAVCHRCWRKRWDPEQEALREERSIRDWKLVTDPIASGAIRPDEMPEQLPSAARAVLRAFYETDVETAVVPEVTASTLNDSISSLGLASMMYAETRSQHTVLRRVK